MASKERKSRQWNDPGHKTGTSEKEMATGVDQSCTVTGSTTAS